MPMTEDAVRAVETLFAKDQAAAALVLAALERLCARYPDAAIKMGKTQAALCEPGPFCMVWPPNHGGIKDRPPHAVMLTFGLPDRLDSPRIAQAVEPYPNRWTHHLVLADIGQLDGELLGWIDRARAFRQSCVRRRGAKRPPAESTEQN